MYCKLNAWCSRFGKIVVIALVIFVILAGILYSIVLGNSLRFPDEFDYEIISQNLIQKHIFSLDGQNPTTYRSPGYPIFLAIFKALGADIVILRILNFLCLGLCIIIVYRLLVRKSSDLAGVLGAVLIVAYPILFYTSGTLYPQILASFLFICVFYLISKKDPPGWIFPFSGLTTGVMILIIPAFLFIIFILGLWFILPKRLGGGHGFLRYIIFVAVAITVISLWIYRNYRVTGEFVLIQSNSGYNLLVGNNENARPNIGTNVDLELYKNRVKNLNLSQVEEDKYCRSLAIAWIRANKFQALKLYFLKWLNYFNYKNELYVKSEESRVKNLIMLLTYGPLLFLLLARIAAARMLSFSSIEKLGVLLYISSAFFYAIFFTRIRFRLPFDFLLIIIVALFIDRFLRKLALHNTNEIETIRK